MNENIKSKMTCQIFIELEFHVSDVEPLKKYYHKLSACVSIPESQLAVLGNALCAHTDPGHCCAKKYGSQSLYWYFIYLIPK